MKYSLFTSEHFSQSLTIDLWKSWHCLWPWSSLGIHVFVLWCGMGAPVGFVRQWFKIKWFW